MISSLNAGHQTDTEVHITFEDQQNINEFARLNAKLVDFKNKLKWKQNYLKSVEEASDEIELSADKTVQFLVGEVFIFQEPKKTQACLEEEQHQLQEDIKDIEERCVKLKNLMSGLKADLYSKFGNHINLEEADV